jgi:hypothetical protein
MLPSACASLTTVRRPPAAAPTIFHLIARFRHDNIGQCPGPSNQLVHPTHGRAAGTGTFRGATAVIGL